MEPMGGDSFSGRMPVSFPSLERAVVAICEIIPVHQTTAERDARIAGIVAPLAREAKAQGIAAETLVVAIRRAWEQRVAPVMVQARDHSDLPRMRAVSALLEAYFADG